MQNPKKCGEKQRQNKKTKKNEKTEKKKKPKQKKQIHMGELQYFPHAF
jgi:hypothetical protein